MSVSRIKFLDQVDLAFGLTMTFSEILQSPVYNDISVAQWLGLTPKQVVKDHLGFSDDTLNRLPKVKPFILPGDTNPLQTNFTSEQE